MDKIYTDVEHILYWSNSIGEFFCPRRNYLHAGYKDRIAEHQLPRELQRAYNTFYDPFDGICAYMVEYRNNYYVALIAYCGEELSEAVGIPEDELFGIIKQNAMDLYDTAAFKGTTLLFGTDTSTDGCNECIFLIPSSCSKERYDFIGNTIWKTIYRLDGVRKINKKMKFTGGIDMSYELMKQLDLMAELKEIAPSLMLTNVISEDLCMALGITKYDITWETAHVWHALFEIRHCRYQIFTNAFKGMAYICIAS